MHVLRIAQCGFHQNVVTVTIDYSNSTMNMSGRWVVSETYD